VSKVLDSATERADDDSWTFQCPGVAGSPCGDPGGRPFHSSGWPTKKTAEARGQQHLDEHEGGEPMPELADFRAEHGLTAHEDGTHAVRIEDES
jgi:hypothetical protein